MKPREGMKCPSCGGQEFEVENLGNPATTWKVTFGSQFFKKKELQACACKKCGFVSLYIEPAKRPPRT
jgi:predicted nucleic-acid-binding Zn-ribbon protein